jgi:broad specificity phosphatase PhoE
MNCDYYALLRHMEAENNAAEKKHAGGDADAYNNVTRYPSSLHELTPPGIEQATVTGEWLKEHNFSFTSHTTSAYLRAIQTGRLLNIRGAHWEVEDSITEKDSGRLNTMNPDEAAAHLAESAQMRHVRDIYRYRPERGESFQDLNTRVWPFFQQLTGRPLIVCHGHVIRVVDRIRMCRQNSWDFGSFKDARGDLPNGVLIEYRKNDKGWWDRRLSVPCKGSVPGEWQPIEPKRYTNGQLDGLIEKVRALKCKEIA